MSFESDFEKMTTAVKAAEDEIVMAAMFHETWKPAAFDEDLRARIGTSYAAHSFNIVRIALRREMILALMRVWDRSKEAVRMTAIAEKLKDERFFQDLVAKRAVRLGMAASGVEALLTEALDQKRQAVLSLVRKYAEGGPGHVAFKKIKALRDERLAHRQAVDASAARDDPDDKEVEAFYVDSLSVVTFLLSLVLAKAFDLNEAGDVYRHHAKFFWAGARGERTEGHPNYRKPTGE
ncbi:hypothetical protein CLU95_6021 [Variovorax sp. 54]|uniref:AbiU2 domain-containing protein n=1 Tax=Variovorax sp. 54 TaxID=2035212 RepID=UPI000C18B377|nr:hypothetical protein [Variovorax sp. 54]PIF78822.1 hypothetical protein CLU95_6021 [Variovorax sp. 54]